MDESTTSAEQTNMDERRWALLAYLFTPVVPLLLLLAGELKDRPFIRPHLIQALALGVVQVALLVLSPFTACISMVAFLFLYVALFYWGFRAYNGEAFEIPYVTDYLRKQGWL